MLCPAPRVKRAQHGALPPSPRQEQEFAFLWGGFGFFFLISLLAVEPCPSSSSCPTLACSHHPANPEVFWLLPSSRQPLASCCILTSGDPSTSRRCFSWFSQGAEIPFPAWCPFQGFTGVLHPPFPLFPLVSWKIPQSTVWADPPNADCRTRLLSLNLCSWEKQELRFLGGTFSALHFSVPSQEQLQASGARSCCLCSPGCWGWVELPRSDGSAAFGKARL